MFARFLSFFGRGRKAKINFEENPAAPPLGGFKREEMQTLFARSYPAPRAEDLQPTKMHAHPHPTPQELNRVISAREILAAKRKDFTPTQSAALTQTNADDDDLGLDLLTSAAIIGYAVSVSTRDEIEEKNFAGGGGLFSGGGATDSWDNDSSSDSSSSSSDD